MNEAGLGMKDAVGDFMEEKLGATFFRGASPVNGVWATPDMVVTGAYVILEGYGVGDHRLFMFFLHLLLLVTYLQELSK